MLEMHKIWLDAMLQREIKETQGALSNERVWEKGYAGEENPHTENVARLEEYVSILMKLKEEIENVK